MPLWHTTSIRGPYLTYSIDCTQYLYSYCMMVVEPILLFIFFSITTITISKILNLSHTTDHLVELVWSVSPILMLLLISSLSLFYTYELEQDNTAEDYSTSITVTGYQWGWNYEFLELVISDTFRKLSRQGIIFVDPVGPYEYYPAFPIQLWSQKIFEKYLPRVLHKISRSIKPFRYFDWNCSYCIDALEPTKSLVIEHPNHVDKFTDYSCVLLSLTRSDVLHSWYVPKLGVKMDAVPGQISKVTILFNHFRSVSYGRCTEVCGPFHSIIPIKVIRLFPNFFYINETAYQPQEYNVFGVRNPKYVAPRWHPPLRDYVNYHGGYSDYFLAYYGLQRWCSLHLNQYVDHNGELPVNPLACAICPYLHIWVTDGKITIEDNWVYIKYLPLDMYHLREEERRELEKIMKLDDMSFLLYFNKYLKGLNLSTWNYYEGLLPKYKYNQNNDDCNNPDSPERTEVEKKYLSIWYKGFYKALCRALFGDLRDFKEDSWDSKESTITEDKDSENNDDRKYLNTCWGFKESIITEYKDSENNDDRNDPYSPKNTQTEKFSLPKWYKAIRRLIFGHLPGFKDD